MTLFIFIAAVMVAAALAWVLWPLLRPSQRPTVERRDVNLNVYRDQFADLDADLARGSLSQDRYDEAKAELERRMLDEARAEPARPARAPMGGRATALAIAVAVPLIAGLLYAKFGAPDAFSPLATAPQNQHELSGQQIDEMIGQLAKRLEKEPDNVEGWAMLARSYYSQRKFTEAAAAYEKLTQLVAEDADLYADYADALAMAQGRQIAGKPLELINKALALDPNQWKALAMAGTEAFDRKDYKAAVAYWEKLKATAGDTPIATQIQASIDEARQLGNLPASTSPVVADNKSKPAPEAAKGAATAPAGKGVQGTVALAPAVIGKVNPNDALFVFARPAGAKMPIAIIRAQAKDLPLKFSLDDSNSMSPQMKLSSFDEVIVAARVSKTGNAMPSSGDLEGATDPVKVGAKGVAVTIDRVVP